MCPCLHIGYGDSHFKLGVYYNDKSYKHLIGALPQDIPLGTGPQWRNECDVLPLKMTGSEVTKNIQKTDINICVYYQNGHNSSKYYAIIFLLQPVSVICIGNHWVGSQ